jgi:hypothetical protein
MNFDFDGKDLATWVASKVNINVLDPGPVDDRSQVHCWRNFRLREAGGGRMADRRPPSIT